MNKTATTTLKNHNTFSGDIDIEDFSTSSPNKKRINKYRDADNLEKLIKEKGEKNKEMKKYQSMTLEELRKMRLISNTNGRPTSTLTDEKWQKEFEVRKLFIKPSVHDRMRGKYSKESEYWNEDTMGSYCGVTNWQSYCRYINDILSNIRAGQVDYTYYIYQIMDLLKFHYNDLKTKYCDGYWAVWLER